MNLKKEKFKRVIDDINMYNETNKRSILIFPKFYNINVIQDIRKKYDRLYGLIEPHITLAFPFQDNISDNLLRKNMKEILNNTKSFKAIFKGIYLSDDNNIFLNCIEGKEKIIQIHDKIYEEILPSHYKKEKEYIPHITLGQGENIEMLKGFNEKFETIVDEIDIEFIDKDEKSIIIDRIKLS